MEPRPSAHKGYQKQVGKAKPGPVKKHAGADYSSPSAGKWPAFIEAIEAGDGDAVKQLMEEGINVNLSRDGVTPLMAAVSAGREEIAALLLGSGANVNEKNEDGATALHKAAAGQSAASVTELLLGFGADPEAKDRTGKTPLALAEERKHAEVAQAIRRHQDRRRTDTREWNEFLNSAEGGPYRAKEQLETLEPYSGLWWVPLAALGAAGLAASPLFGLVPSISVGLLLGALVAGGLRLRMLMLSSHLDRYEPLPDLDINLLRQKRAAGEPVGVVKHKKRHEAVDGLAVAPVSSSVDIPSNDPLPIAVEPEDGDVLFASDIPPMRHPEQKKAAIWKVVVPAVVIVLAALVAVLAFYRAPIIRRYYALKLERSGMPFTGAAFLNAVANNDTAAVDLFIKAGATGAEKNEKGQTALFIAAEKGHDSLLPRLIALNPGMIGQPDVSGMTPLMTAAVQGHEAAVRALIENHANVDQEAIGPDGNITALQAVLDSPEFTDAHRKIVLYLLEKGADVKKRNAAGEPPLLIAAARGNLDALKVLREKGVDIRDADSDGETALYVAACQGYPDLIAFLLEQGAEVTAATNEGDTSLLCAAREGETASVSVLVKKGAGIDSRSSRGWTALTEASAAGNAEVVKLLLDMGANPSTGYVPEAYRGMKGSPVLIRRGKKTIGDILRLLAGTATVDGYSLRYGELSSRKTTMSAKGPWNVVLSQLATKEHLFPLFKEKEIYLIPYAPPSRRGTHRRARRN